jgi:hypothetical protein
MGKVLLISMSAMVVLMLIVLIDRYRLESLRNELDELRIAAETRGANTISALAPTARN